ncbi:MAG: hypothetical protein DRP42_07965 [Tenericutes bacterium]|nr:MAG: hypothetical protein DRP42_07965 [Mycoplasmatota bacterium]
MSLKHLNRAKEGGVDPVVFNIVFNEQLALMRNLLPSGAIIDLAVARLNCLRGSEPEMLVMQAIIELLSKDGRLKKCLSSIMQACDIVTAHRSASEETWIQIAGVYSHYYFTWKTTPPASTSIALRHLLLACIDRSSCDRDSGFLNLAHAAAGVTRALDVEWADVGRVDVHL